MESTFKAELEASADFAKLTRIQKLAALLLMLSPENAAHIMKSLDEYDLEEVSAEMVKVNTVNIVHQDLLFGGVIISRTVKTSLLLNRMRLVILF